MLAHITLSYFKNFSEATRINLCCPTDTSFVDVIVGKNGTGKSCIAEAIDWCLVHAHSREMRASNMNQLVNTTSPDGKMFVSIEIYSKKTSYITICHIYLSNEI
jgi:chromosome segregation ATPase